MNQRPTAEALFAAIRAAHHATELIGYREDAEALPIREREHAHTLIQLRLDKMTHEPVQQPKPVKRLRSVQQLFGNHKRVSDKTNPDYDAPGIGGKLP